ncbi:hypothetical protein ACFY65_23415 [Streptomyces cellulosae]
MATSHQITCAGEDCPEWSIRTAVHGTHPEWLAAEHRELLAAAGWVDVEGRDYCPDHAPAA